MNTGSFRQTNQRHGVRVPPTPPEGRHGAQAQEGRRGAQAQEPEEGAAQGTLVPEESQEALPVVLDVGGPVAVVPVLGAEPI